MSQSNCKDQQLARLSELMQAAAPHQRAIQEIAAEVIKIQQDCIEEQIVQAFPKVHFETVEMVGGIMNTTKPEEVDKAITHLVGQGITVERVLFDRVRGQYILIGGAR